MTLVIQAKNDGGFAQGEKERNGLTGVTVRKSGQDLVMGSEGRKTPRLREEVALPKSGKAED